MSNDVVLADALDEYDIDAIERVVAHYARYRKRGRGEQPSVYVSDVVRALQRLNTLDPEEIERAYLSHTVEDAADALGLNNLPELYYALRYFNIEQKRVGVTHALVERTERDITTTPAYWEGRLAADFNLRFPPGKKHTKAAVAAAVARQGYASNPFLNAGFLATGTVV